MYNCFQIWNCKLFIIRVAGLRKAVPRGGAVRRVKSSWARWHHRRSQPILHHQPPTKRVSAKRGHISPSPTFISNSLSRLCKYHFHKIKIIRSRFSALTPINTFFTHCNMNHYFSRNRLLLSLICMKLSFSDIIRNFLAFLIAVVVHR